MILLDTNVVSEFMRPRPSAAVQAWAVQQRADSLGVTAVTVHEIEFGIARMPRGARRDTLQRSWAMLLNSFTGWVLPLDEAAAHATAEALQRASAQGRVMGVADAQIAGIAVSTRSPLATRHTKDFSSVEGLALLNPFGLEN